MMIYIVVYAISLYFTYKACDSKLWWNHILATVLPVLLLTFRDESVGTDTGHYIDIYDFCESADSLILCFGCPASKFLQFPADLIIRTLFSS